MNLMSWLARQQQKDPEFKGMVDREKAALAKEMAKIKGCKHERRVRRPEEFRKRYPKRCYVCRDCGAWLRRLTRRRRKA